MKNRLPFLLLAIIALVLVPITSAFAISFRIVETSLPDATVGVVYSTTLTTIVGTDPNTWSVSVGTLPDGLSLNTSTGEISGTPTTAGPVTFTIHVVDSTPDTPQEYSTEFTITVKAVSDAPVVASPIAVGATSVSGTSSEADNTTIELFIDYVSVGTTTVTSNSWTMGSLTALTVGQIVKATALADTKVVSDTSNTVIVQEVCTAPVVTSPIVKGSTSVSGTSTEADGTTIQLYVDEVATGTTVAVASGAWTKSGLTALNYDQYVKATATASGKIVSVYSDSVKVDKTPAPVVTSSIVAGATSVSGTSSEADGTSIEVFVDAVSAGTTSVSSGNWTLGSLAVLTPGQTVNATATAAGRILSSNSASVIVITDFRSVASGIWDSTSTWEQWNGSIWAAATSKPTSSDNVITILSPHVVVVTSNISVDQLVINSGATLVDSTSKTLTVANGADSVDMVVNGTLRNFGTVTPTGRISFENNSFYYHQYTGGGGTVPASTWRDGSTCEIDSATGSASPAGINNQSFYHYIWNCSRITGTVSAAFPNGYTFRGDFTLANNGGAGIIYRLITLSAGVTHNIYFKGNLNITGPGYLTTTGSGASATASAIFNVDGNINLSAGTLGVISNSTPTGNIKVKGNFNMTGGTLTSGGTFGKRYITFNGTTQSFTKTGGTLTTTLTWKVDTNAAVTLGFPWSLIGTMILNGGKVVTSSTNLLTMPTDTNLKYQSPISYIDGPLQITVASTSAKTLNFPIGKGSINRPMVLTVNMDAVTSTTFTAEMFNSTPPANTLPAALLSVSPARYYTITKGTGANISPTLGGTIKLTYDRDDSVDNAFLARVAMDTTGSKWVSLGGSGTVDTIGTITSNAFFTLGTNVFVTAKADTTTPVSVPTLLTNAMSKISTTFATSGGNITNDGGAAVTARGVCWNTTGSPAISDSKTTDGNGSGAFTSSVTGLTPGVTYYLSAYATNSAGTAYGNVDTFATLAAIVPPTVTTTAISNILVTSAQSGGNVTAWGGDSVTARGVCWNTAGTPTISNSHSSDGSDLGSYTSGLAPLIGTTTYYVRAYATNSSGTGYGDQLSFSTQTAAPDTTVVVAWDGSGNYTTVQAAFRAVPANYTGKWKIFVKKGLYHEKDTLASGKINVILEGEERDSTVIWTDSFAERDGGTSSAFTIAIDASDFIAKNITFENTYWPNRYGTVTGTQAVAVRTQGDRHEFINCVFNGYQDTYYTWGGSGTGRSYHKNCMFKGTVDYIFGRNICVFDSCTFITARAGGVITAGATDLTSQYGYVFRNCTLLGDTVGSTDSTGWVRTAYTATNGYYLGRPWQGGPRTVYLNCNESANLHAAGWTTMSVNPALYAEYNCWGPGSSFASRSTNPPCSQLTTGQANNYTLANIFAKSSASSSLILYDWMPTNASSFDDNPPLPVELANFTAQSAGLKIVLSWSTATETNNYGFEVERRSISENTNWEKIAFIQGVGTSTSGNNYSFEDKNLTNGRYEYRLKQIDNSGAFKYSASVEIDNAGIPKQFTLSNGYPNPFNPSANIQFSLESDGLASLKVFNILGQHVATLFEENAVAGNLYEIKFDAKSLASGIYFARLESAGKVKITKLVLMK